MIEHVIIPLGDLFREKQALSLSPRDVGIVLYVYGTPHVAPPTRTVNTIDPSMRRVVYLHYWEHENPSVGNFQNRCHISIFVTLVQFHLC